MEMCPICTGVLVLRREVRDVPLGKRSVSIEDEFYVCADCGEELVDREMMDRTLRRAAEKIRREEGLLTPDEIIRIRADLGISQANLERLINAGPKTVTRWERGTVVQNGTADTVLQILRDHPEVAVQLARKRGVDLPMRVVPTSVYYSTRTCDLGYAFVQHKNRIGPRFSEFRTLHSGGIDLDDWMGDLRHSPVGSPPQFGLYKLPQRSADS